MPATYGPPCDSPIKDIFALHYVKYASDTVDLLPQVEAKTLCGTFVVDFVIRNHDGYRVGIECDGKGFHNESRDEWRDAMILGEGHLDVIYRIRGSDLNYYVEDVLYLLAELEPRVFEQRAIANLKVLASPEVQGAAKGRNQDLYYFHYRNGDDTGAFRLELRRRVVPENQRRFWQAAYNHAVSIGGGRLDDVIANYRKSGDI
jgi:hypothetical protein